MISQRLQYGADGSLTIHIQAETLSAEKVSSWLPAPTGAFSVALRIYLP